MASPNWIIKAEDMGNLGAEDFPKFCFQHLYFETSYRYVEGRVGVRDLVLHGYIWSDLWRSLVVLFCWAVAGMAFGLMMFRVKAE